MQVYKYEGNQVCGIIRVIGSWLQAWTKMDNSKLSFQNKRYFWLKISEMIIVYVDGWLIVAIKGLPGFQLNWELKTGWLVQSYFDKTFSMESFALAHLFYSEQMFAIWSTKHSPPNHISAFSRFLQVFAVRCFWFFRIE